ncbi:MAG: PEP-CTERM sorting domain-containing protein [Pseudomonadota bacterium]
MTVMRLALLFVLTLASGALIGGPAQAIIKDYTYVGNPFTEAVDPLSTSDFLKIEFRIDCVAAGGSGDCVDLPFDDYSGAVSSFTFESGPLSIESGVNVFFEFSFSTGPDMLIDDWIVSAGDFNEFPVLEMQSSRFMQEEFPTLDRVILSFGEGAETLGIVDANPGDWSVTGGGGSVPEPGTLALFVIALGTLGLLMRRRTAVTLQAQS